MDCGGERRDFPILLCGFFEQLGSNLTQLVDEVHVCDLVDMDVGNECVGVILGKSGVIAGVKILQQSLDSISVLLGKVDVCFILLLQWC